ncbi:MAG: AAA family ATPase [Planctomycetota bacterium]
MTTIDLAHHLREQVLEPIKQSLVGKDEIVELLGVALVAGENLFLLGPPGTAKSALVLELAARLRGRSFDYLLTRFTEPSELFGPFDLRRLRDGDLVTNTEGMLPEADVVFLDELMNANSAILNSLLLALNERVFRRGRQTEPLPMLFAVGASNQLPADDALAALFDRFLIRVLCENVPDDHLDAVLDAGWRRDRAEPADASLSVDDVRALNARVPHVDLNAVRPALIELITRLRSLGIPISDRRAVRLQRLIAASAVLCSREQAELSDLWVLQHIWDAPPQREILAAQIDAIQEQFNADEPTAQHQHPMAQSQKAPSAELLQRQLDTLQELPTSDSVEDELTLLAARVEWVEDETAREHLRSGIESLRERWRNASE